MCVCVCGGGTFWEQLEREVGQMCKSERACVKLFSVVIWMNRL